MIRSMFCGAKNSCVEIQPASMPMYWLVAGIADQRPSQGVGRPEEVGQVAGALEALGAPAGADALAQRREGRQVAVESALDDGAEGGKHCGRRLHGDAGQVVVGREGED